MKSIVLFFLVFVTFGSSRKILKCGTVSSACVQMLDNGRCPSVPFCPAGFKRRPIGDSCCCFLKKASLPTDLPGQLDVMKAKVVHRTLKKMRKYFDDATPLISATVEDSERKKFIDEAGEWINAEIIFGIRQLAALVGVEFLDILPHVFEDESCEDDDERIKVILQDAKRIYESGEWRFKFFQKVVQEMGE